MPIQNITVKELQEHLSDDVILIDLREENVFAQDHIPHAIRMERDVLLSADGTAVYRLIPELKSHPESCIVVYCQFGVLSKEIAEHLCELGFHALHLEGGYGKWLAEILLQTAADETRRETVESSLRKRFRRDITSRFVKAISNYDLIQPGDRIAVCISGGKDSMLMAKLFQEIKRRNKIPFDVVFLCMDPGYSETTLGMIQANASLLGIPLTMFSSPIFDAVDHITQSPCYICARMRRGYLYSKAKELGCNKISLGHHYDDVIETTLMSILYSGQVQTMMPKLHSTNFEGMELIRPMYLIREEDIKKWRDTNGLQFIRCACHFTDTCSIEGKGDSNSKRLEAKHLIAELKKTNDNIEGNLFRSMQNIHLDAVLGYKKGESRHSFLDSYNDA